MEDHEWEDLPVCPSCGHKDQDWYDGLESKGDGDSWEADCPACGAGYTVTLHLLTKFDTANASGHGRGLPRTVDPVVGREEQA